MATLSIDELSVRYGERIAVRPTSVELHSGTLVALIGPNGAGKSSLLKALAGVVPRMGRVTWDRRALEPLGARERARLIAYLPQSRAAHWPMTTHDLVALGRLPHRALGQRETQSDRDAVEWAMQQADVAAFAERGVEQLSGGERARVLLARALAVAAPVLLVDEPIASLDPYHQLQIMIALQRYARQGALVVAVLHDLALAARFCARAILVHEGALVGDGTPEHVLNDRALRQYYRIEPHIAAHDGQPVVLPWRPL